MCYFLSPAAQLDKFDPRPQRRNDQIVKSDIEF